jgi:hypothetical protein
VALVVLGVILLAVAWLAWSGRWRGWAKIAVTPQMMTTMVPGLGTILLLGGLGSLAGGAASGVLIGLGFAAMAAAAVLFFWNPDWWGPRWFRERDRTAYDLSVPLNAAVAASVRPDPGDRASEAVVRAEMGGAEPLARWRAHLVTDEHGRPSAMQRTGVVRGHLLLYADALAFAADAGEDRMRGRAVTRIVPAASLRNVEPVPAGSRPEGAESGGDLPSKVMPRLRIDTTTGPLFVETARAARRARELAQRYLGGVTAAG